MTLLRFALFVVGLTAALVATLGPAIEYHPLTLLAQRVEAIVSRLGD